MPKQRVFYSVLNMGLGHASRSLPLIREFVHRKWEVLIGSNGRAYDFLRNELPDLKFVKTPDYAISYSKRGNLFFKLLAQAPRVIRKIIEERHFCRQMADDFLPDLIFSDHCYGMYHQRIPSYFLSHQIYFALPGYLTFMEAFAARFNLHFHKRYHKILIPDLKQNNGGMFSGKLSHLPESGKNYFYGGVLSSITRQPNVEEDLDILISVSGPEPQRTVFEEKILKEIHHLPGRKVVVLGKTEVVSLIEDAPNLKVYSHIPRQQMELLVNKARLVISRPGYSTLMELAELGKRALLVPTPGQTEQDYLAQLMMSNQWFYCVTQNKLDLGKDVEIAKTFSGLYLPNATQNTVNKVFNTLL